MNQPTQAILQKYGISPTPNPPQAVSGNAQVRNINSSTVNNQVNNKIIIIQPQIPIAQPNIQLRDTQGEGLRNWISNQFKAQQQKYQEENNFYKKYGERITDGIQRVTRSVTNATERFAENMNPQKLSRTMTDSKKVLVMMFLATLATKFIGPLSKRIDKLYKWFVGDGNKAKGFIEKFKETVFPDNKENGILGKLKKGISYGLSLLKGYAKLAIEDRVRALSELREHDLKDVSLFDISEIPSMLLKVFAALIGGSKGLGFIKTRSAGRKIKKKVLEMYTKWGSNLKNDFDSLGNVKNEQNSVYRVQKKIESLINDVFKSRFTLDVPTVQILSLLEALTGAIFTCYQYDDKLVRGTIINNAKNFLTLLGYYGDEISQLFEKEYIVDIKSIVKDRNNSTVATGNQVITEEGWKVMAIFFNAERISVSDRNYYSTFEKRITERWKAYWKEELAGDEKAISLLDKVKLIDTKQQFYKDEANQLRRAWDFNDELEAARQSDREIFENENQEALSFFRGLRDKIGGMDEESLEDINQFNENNYQEVVDGEFNTELAAQEVRKLSLKRFDKNHNIVCRKPENESSGHCAMHVRMAIEKGGVDLSGHPSSAYEYMTFLPKKGFKLIHSGRKRDLENPDVYPFSNDLKKGDVVVFNRTATHPDGHIAIYDGQNWYADYRHGTWHGLSDRGFNEFGVFRFTSSKSPQGNLDEARAAIKEQSTNKESIKELVQARYYKKTDTLPESAAPSGLTSTTTFQQKNLGKTITPSTPSTRTTSKQSTGKLSEANPDSHVSTYGEPVEDLAVAANPEIKVNTYARKGTTQQKMLHHTMIASYTNGIKTD